MGKNSAENAVFTIPNLLSILRLLMIPILIVSFWDAQTPGEYRRAAIIAAASFLTDFFDGYLARKWNCITYAGRILDPVVDKCMQFAVLLCLCRNEPVFRPLLALLAAKEAFQLTAGIYYLRRRKLLKAALPAGKAATALLFLSFFFIILLPEMGLGMKKWLATANFIALSAALICYGYTYCTGRGSYEELPQK